LIRDSESHRTSKEDIEIGLEEEMRDENLKEEAKVFRIIFKFVVSGESFQQPQPHPKGTMQIGNNKICLLAVSTKIRMTFYTRPVKYKHMSEDDLNSSKLCGK